MSDNPYQQPAATAAPPIAGSETAQVVAPLYERRGWIKLLGVLSIIYGAFSCLSIFGAIWGIPLIFAGVNMFQAASAYDEGFPHHSGQLREASQKLATAFLIQGIVALIFLILGVLYILFIILMLIGIAGAGIQ